MFQPVTTESTEVYWGTGFHFLNQCLRIAVLKVCLMTVTSLTSCNEGRCLV